MELISRTHYKRQRGVVLIVALVFLISLTAVASALMLNSTTDIKMAGASQEKVEAVQEAISALDETIADQVVGGTNLFAGTQFPQVVDTVGSVNVTNVTITNNNTTTKPVGCPHSALASSTDKIGCNVLTITVNNNYGRKNTSNINAQAGIAQEVLDL